MSKKNERIRGREKARIARQLKITELAIAYHEEMGRIGMRWSVRIGSSGMPCAEGSVKGAILPSGEID
jgi:hypothetical protein